MDIKSLNQLLDLTDKVAIVTGGSLGIGYGICYRLAEAGAKVVVVSRNEVEVKKAVDNITASNFQAFGVKGDVSIETDVQNIVEQTLAKYGDIDILVNNAGIFPLSLLKDLTVETFDKTIAINLRGVFLMTKYVSEQMKKQGKGGKIINITSIDALHPSITGLSHYDASKHGVWGFTKNVAKELAEYNIWVNAVAPGGVMTPGVASMQGSDTKFVEDSGHIDSDAPMKRMGTPDEIAKVVLFLASDMSSYMTGSQVVVDGGSLLK